MTDHRLPTILPCQKGLLLLQIYPACNFLTKVLNDSHVSGWCVPNEDSPLHEAPAELVLIG